MQLSVHSREAENLCLKLYSEFVVRDLGIVKSGFKSRLWPALFVNMSCSHKTHLKTKTNLTMRWNR